MMETHGKTGTRVYRAWKHMKSRCLNPNNKNYQHYAGRGITICPEWVDSFSAFYEHMGDPPSDKHSLDRIDTCKGYFPGNCRWATQKEQNNNQIANRKIECAGRVMNLSQWAQEIGISDKALDKRLRDGWTVEDALTRPLVKLSSRVIYKGMEKSLPEWAAYLGVPKKRIVSRLRRGWSVEEAFESPMIPKELVGIRRRQVQAGLLERKVPSK